MRCTALFIVIALNSCVALAEPGADVLIRGLAPEYARHDIIQFEVMNAHSESVEFYCAVERSKNGEWSEIVLSVLPNEPAKAVFTTRIAAGESARMSWNPAGEKIEIGRGQYRLKVVLNRESDDSGLPLVFSPPFTIK